MLVHAPVLFCAKYTMAKNWHGDWQKVFLKWIFVYEYVCKYGLKNDAFELQIKLFTMGFWILLRSPYWDLQMTGMDEELMMYIDLSELQEL